MHMSVTRWDVMARNASLGPCATVQWIFFDKRYGDVVIISIDLLRREGTREQLPSLFSSQKVNRLIDFYDLISMIKVPIV